MTDVKRSLCPSIKGKTHDRTVRIITLSGKTSDRVKRNDLWRTLSMRDVSSGLIQAPQSLYRGSSANIRINGTYTDWFDIRRGSALIDAERLGYASPKRHSRGAAYITGSTGYYAPPVQMPTCIVRIKNTVHKHSLQRPRTVPSACAALFISGA
ncbi:hypothetical protein EVAR_14351_1 [Eumeta japonica]|uniref:Uncharacterized protein n=1 Tax=Eumeta variegata TaxID=151549 RepID=A0A4C1TWZ9_EUMVA|nr:hypothetical protein EVAR_14351_1 [Eumeta japonica]